jgi:endonuclease G
MLTKRIETFLMIVMMSVLCYAQTFYSNKIDKEKIVNFTYITISYNQDNNIPNYVGECLTYDRTLGTIPRNQRFKSYPAITSIKHETYTGTGYDRGHMAPAADFKSTSEGMNDSFSILNVAPQLPRLNRQYWEKLEAFVRKKSIDADEVFVVTGTIISKHSKKVNGITVPDAFYKAIIGIKGNKNVMSAAWIYHNVETQQSIRDCMMTIDELEAKIGLDLFPTIGDSKTESRIFGVW